MLSRKFQTPSEVKLEPNEESIPQIQAKGPFLITHPEKERVYHKRRGEWKLEENVKYAVFVMRHQHEMQGKPHGKLWGIHQKMEQYIKTRNFRQCKGRHQELVQKCGSIPSIIQYLSLKNPNFQSLFLKEQQNYLPLKLQQNSVNPQPEKKPVVDHSGKADKDDQIPTDIAYRNEYPQQYPGTSQNGLPSLIRNISSFPMQGFPSYFQPPENGQLNPYQKFYQFPTTHSIQSEPRAFACHQPTQSRQLKWKQCHNLFLQWVKRVNQLALMTNPDF